MPEWLTILLVVMGGTAGTGGLWGGARWTVRWWERRGETKHRRALELEQERTRREVELEQERSRREEAWRRHEEAMALRWQAMQATFLDALRKIQADAEEKTDRHRTEHLADLRLTVQALAAKERNRESSSPSSR